jgi:hypothetical protein
MKIIITENQYNLLKEMEDDLISYNSDFKPGVNILVIFENNPNYPNLKNFFDEYGYGFYFPEQNLIIIDGEIFLGENGLTMKDLKFIEAHEVTHLLLNHNGPRSEEDEIEADLGALAFTVSLLAAHGRTVVCVEAASWTSTLWIEERCLVAAL